MKLNILLLCHKAPVGKIPDTILDHIDALQKYSMHTIWVCSVMGDMPKNLDLSQFDIVIIHYSICILNDYFLSKKAKTALQSYTGLKVIFIQDEYRQVQHMLQELAYIKIDVIFSCFAPQEITKIYPKSKLPNVSCFPNLTGYISDRLLAIERVPPISARPIHVGYRARKLPFWYGELAYEKWNIVEQWLAHTGAEKLNDNLSYHDKDRIYGHAWIKFLQSCKTTLGG